MLSSARLGANSIEWGFIGVGKKRFRRSTRHILPVLISQSPINDDQKKKKTKAIKIFKKSGSVFIIFRKKSFSNSVRVHGQNQNV